MDGNVFLKVTIQCLAFMGFWPFKFKYKIFVFLYAVYYKITISVFAIFVLSQFIEIYMVIGKSLEELSGLMAINFLYTLGLVKIWVIGGTTVKTLVKKIQFTEKSISANGNDEIKEIYMEHVSKNYNANRLMMFLGIMCYFMFILTPTFTELVNPLTAYFDIIDNYTVVYRERPLPLVSWFPFDRYKYYNIAFSWHVIAAVFTTTYIVACNNMFFGLMIFAAGQIKILQHNLQTIKPIEKLPTKTIEDLVIADNLRKCIIYHNAIIKFVQELEKTMRFFLLLDFAACALQIAMIGFEVAVAELSFQLLKNIIYLGSMVTQLFLFYWHGNEVLLESATVANAIWTSEWYEYNVSAQKTLLQIVMRAQRPLKLSVGSFYHMSTDTMVTILKSSYTYAAVMRQFYSRKLNP